MNWSNNDCSAEVCYSLSCKKLHDMCELLILNTASVLHRSRGKTQDWHLGKTWVQQADRGKSQKDTSAPWSYFCSMVGIEKERRKVRTVGGIILNRQKR